MSDATNDTTSQQELKRLSDNIHANPIPDHWEMQGDSIEDADGGIHAQWYSHKTEPLMMVVIFPCGACASDVRFVVDARVAESFAFTLDTWDGWDR